MKSLIPPLSAWVIKFRGLKVPSLFPVRHMVIDRETKTRKSREKRIKSTSIYIIVNCVASDQTAKLQEGFPSEIDTVNKLKIKITYHTQ